MSIRYPTLEIITKRGLVIQDLRVTRRIANEIRMLCGFSQYGEATTIAGAIIAAGIWIGRGK